ncbi:MAG: peptidoglycan DD-metalloendopeptidase family protein [Wenzhouxiangella sp.]
MRNHYQITITDYRGARHFTLNQLMRRSLLVAAGVLGILLVTGSILLHVLTGRVGNLNAELSELAAERSRIETERQSLVDERDQLEAQVEDRSRALLALSDELENIEILIGVRAEPERPLAQRVDTASQTAFEKRLMLNSIPSGFPLDSERITSGFGMRRHPIQDRMAMHGGIDFSAPLGTPIHATADGVVEWAAFHESSGLGKMVRLIHNYGFSTVYGHLDKIEVAPGNYVQRGDLIGYSGNTGASTGPHLHYEVRHLNRRLDPDTFLRWSISEYDILFANEERVEWESLVEIIRSKAKAAERPSLLPVQSWSATLP